MDLFKSLRLENDCKCHQSKNYRCPLLAHIVSDKYQLSHAYNNQLPHSPNFEENSKVITHGFVNFGSCLYTSRKWLQTQHI